MCNCGWGYLCQKPHADENIYFNNLEEEDVIAMTKLIDGLETPEDSRRMKGLPVQVGIYTHIKTTKKPEDITVPEMNKKVAYQTGGLAPAGGLILLSNEILKLHPSQPVYCDTDSIFMVRDSENKDYKDIKTGLFMGDFMDEYPDHRIVEYVCIGPKSYFIKLVGKDGKISYKGRFKGLPMNSGTFSLLDKRGELAKLGMEEMKNILFASLPQMDGKSKSSDVDSLALNFKYTNFFKRGPGFKIVAVQEQKTVQFTFDKRRVVLPVDEKTGERISFTDPRFTEINTVPINDEGSLHTMHSVQEWWKNLRTIQTVPVKVHSGLRVPMKL
jgi:hypothetical protein